MRKGGFFSRLLLCCAPMAVTACSPAQGGHWSRPDPERPAPERAPPLALPGSVQIHQVAIDSPGRSDVMVGRLRFPGADAYELEAQADMGVRLFTVGFDGHRFRADVAAPLRDKLPAERLAQDIAHVYLDRSPAGARFEDRRSERGSLLARTVTGADGRVLRVTYEDYGWWGPAWLPRRVHLVADKLRVDILVVGFEQGQ